MNQRDARKLATRTSLAEAAIDLFATRGFDETRVEDIAAAAGVSARTFFLHFPSKEDAAFPDHDERVAALAEALAADEPDGDPMPLVRAAVALAVRDVVGSRVRASRQRLFHDIDALRSRDVLGDLDYEEVIVAHLVGRGRTEFAARAAAVSVVGIARAALTTWVHDPSFDPVAAATDALERVE